MTQMILESGAKPTMRISEKKEGSRAELLKIPQSRIAQYVDSILDARTTISGHTVIVSEILKATLRRSKHS